MMKPRKKYDVPYSQRVGLIDGDIIVYNSAFAAMRDGLPLNETIFLMEEMLVNIKEMISLSDCTIYLSDSADHNFRHKVATTVPYKGTRKKEKPTYYVELREHLVSQWDAIISKGMEADDYMGMNQTDTSVIITIDKDLDQIVGWHYNFKRMKMYYVEELEAIRYFYIQMLTGDRSDNIKGLYRVGPVKAYNALKDVTSPHEMKRIVKKMYSDMLGDQAEARYKENQQLLMIRGMPLDTQKKIKAA